MNRKDSPNGYGHSGLILLPASRRLVFDILTFQDFYSMYKLFNNQYQC